MKISKLLLIKAFLAVVGVFGANGISKADAARIDGFSGNSELTNEKLSEIKLASCIVDDYYDKKSVSESSSKGKLWSS